MKRYLTPGWLMWGAAVVVAALLIGASVVSIIQLREDFDEARADRASLASDVDVLRAQLEAEGIEPEVGPAGAAGERGEPGERGLRGPTGPAGEDGITPPCFFTISQCIGATGPAGPAGEDGADGQDGEDGADGAPGEDGATGAQGETGPAGPQGETGPQGPQGEPGPSCPEGYSLQPSMLQGDDVLVCTRDEEPAA